MRKINVFTVLLGLLLLFCLTSCSQPTKEEVAKEPTKEEKAHDPVFEYTVKGKLVETEDLNAFSDGMSQLQEDGHITFRTIVSSTLFEYRVEYAGDASTLSQLINEHVDLELSIDISDDVLYVTEAEVDDV